MLGELRELEATATARMLSAGAQPAEKPAQELLDIDEAAERLKVSTDYLYRHWKQFPFACKQPFGLRFSARGLDQYIHESVLVSRQQPFGKMRAGRRTG